LEGHKRETWGSKKHPGRLEAPGEEFGKMPFEFFFK
jgi:hypothetical protein